MIPLRILLSVVLGLFVALPLRTFAMGSKKKPVCSTEASNRTYLYEEEIEACGPDWLNERINRRKMNNDHTNEVPEWLTDLADRFTILGNGIRVAKSRYDIDRWVGHDPWTLRADTQAALEMIQTKSGISLYQFFTGNLAGLFHGEEPDSFPPGINGQLPMTSLGTTSSPTVTFELSEDMTRHFPSAVILDPLRRALTEEQMIDLGVYIISKAPFFPKKTDPDAWDKWSAMTGDLLYYDIYLALAVAAAAAFTNKAQFSIGGWLFKLPGDHVRIGWIGKAKHLGAHGTPEAEVGLKAESKDVAGAITYYRDLSANDREMLKASFVDHWFNQYFQGTGWNTSGSLNGQYELRDRASPSLQNTTSVGVGVTIHKDHLVNSHGPELTVSGGISYATNGAIVAGTTVIVSDPRNDLSISTNLATNPLIQTDGKEGRDVRATVVGIWTPSGGLDKISQWLSHDIAGLKEDLISIGLAKERLAKAKTENSKYSAEFWLEGARVAMRYHLRDYAQDNFKYQSIKRPSEDIINDLDEDFLKTAKIEAGKSIFSEIQDKAVREEKEESFARTWGRMHFRTGMDLEQSDPKELIKALYPFY